jgi:hypothetical protein
LLPFTPPLIAFSDSSKTIYSMVCVAYESLLFDFFMSQSLSKHKMRWAS